MNEIETDWIDDILNEDSPEYDDPTDTNYENDYAWHISSCYGKIMGEE